MSPFRLLLRWAMTLLAIGLAIVAVLLLALRLLASQVDEVRPRLETLLADRFNADSRIASLQASWHGLDPAIGVAGLQMFSRTPEGPLPLLEVESGRLRLDSSATLREGVPVVDDARVRGLTLHLYQTPDRTWHWPEPAALPPELHPDDEFDLERLDFWVGLLLRQRVEVEQVRLVLHGQEREVTLEAPHMLMTGDERRAHLEGWLYVEGEEDVSLEAALEVLPGSRGVSHFNAALQARMNVTSLVHLADVFSRNDSLRLDRATGEAIVWGRWHEGELADARLDLEIPELAMSRDDERLALQDIRARGQWLRSDDGWEAWLSLLDEITLNVDDGQASPSTGPALPRHWQVMGDGKSWSLKGSEFHVGPLFSWSEYLPLPDNMIRAFQALEPRGRVSGFEIKRSEGRWLTRAALHELQVSPWRNAPGGGPVDGWLEADGLNGQIRFYGAGDAVLDFPELFAAPMELSYIHGDVGWVHEGGRTRVSSDNLDANWAGAWVQGSFDLEVGDDRPGELGLDLAFHDVDAIEIPLATWLPVGILGEGVNEWLALGASGRVPEGRLKLRQPLFEGVEADDVTLDLNLRVEQGWLPFDAEWPALENVSGHLHFDDLDLRARVEHVESHGVWGRDGTVTLVDDMLAIQGQVGGSTEAILTYAEHSPWGDLDTSDWESRGELLANLSLEMPLESPKDLALDADVDVDVPYLRFVPLNLAVHAINGQVGYRHRDGDGGASGVLGARLFDGPLTARFDSRDRQVSFEGRALARGVFEQAGLEEMDSLLNGYFPYAARLSLESAGPRLRLDSDLVGLGIDLPPPFGKDPQQSVPLLVEADLDAGLVEASLAERAQLRWRKWQAAWQGQLWLETWPETPEWPQETGWHVNWHAPRLEPQRWLASVEQLGLGGMEQPASPDVLRTLRLGTDCLYLRQRCLGTLFASAYPHVDDSGAWRVDLAGDLLEGRADYVPLQDHGRGFVDQAGVGPIDIALQWVNLDSLLPEASGETDIFDEVNVAPEPEAFPDWVSDFPGGRLRVGVFERQGERFGPLTAYWRASPEQLVVSPLGLTLGQVSARGELVWETAGSGASLTRSRLSLDGGDLGTALERLGQPVSINNRATSVRSQLAWPGAPWQFALERSRGSLDIDLRDGRFRYLESPSAKLVGLLNVDNLVRRLRLDFSDVTRQGTAFDSVLGGATLYEGRLETRGPVEIQGPATSFTLNGEVDLARRELDQHLAVTVPLSQNLPLAALVAGGPVVGGALFIAHRLFGRTIDRATQIHYRVRGPWTSPDIALEGAE